MIQCFQIGKETEELFGSCVKDVEESRYHSRFCESSGEVFALSLTYGTCFFRFYSVPGRLQKEKYLQMQC